MCREHGQTLSALAAKEGTPLDGFGIFGIIKETDVDDEGLMEFRDDYFPHPIYRDADLCYYEALGNEKLKLTSWNPIKLYRGMKKIGRRMKEKKIDGNLKGEGLVKGGVILFGKDGDAKFAHLEKTGEDLPVEEIIAAADAVREEISK